MWKRAASALASILLFHGATVQAADGNPSATSSVFDDPAGVMAGASSSYYSQPDAVSSHPTSGSPNAVVAVPSCTALRPGDGGVVVDQFVATPIGDCVSYVLLRRGDSEILQPGQPVEPLDLLPLALDKARALASVPALEFAPRRIGLTGLPSYFWLAEEPPAVSATAEVPGLSVTAEASPAQYVWHFGDDGSQVTDHYGRPWSRTARGSIAHTYEFKGDMTVSVEVVYQARWRIGGGAWRPLGYFSVADSTDYPVQEIRTVLTRSRR